MAPLPRGLAVWIKLTGRRSEVQEKDGDWYRFRLSPYRTLDDRIDGVVLSIVRMEEHLINARDHYQGVFQIRQTRSQEQIVAVHTFEEVAQRLVSRGSCQAVARRGSLILRLESTKRFTIHEARSTIHENTDAQAWRNETGSEFPG